MSKAMKLEPDQDTLMRTLGYLLLNWSTLEQAVKDDIKRLRISDGDTGTTSVRTRGAFNERLAEWRALMSLKSRRNPEVLRHVAEIAGQAEFLCRTRNLIAHHFTGAERTASGEWLIYASENGLSSPRASHAAFSLKQLDELNQQMRTVCERIGNLKEVLAA